MRKIFYFTLALLLVCSNSFASNQWRAGTGADTILGTERIYDIDAKSFQNIVDPLDRLLANYRRGCRVTYSSAAQLTVGAGELTASNTAGTIRQMLKNASATTVTWSDIDAGAEASSTTYYVYGGTTSTSAETITFKISVNATTPTGLTYYIKLASFYNDASGNITRINNDGFFADLGEWESKSNNTAYQASYDGFIIAQETIGGTVKIFVDGASSPVTERIQQNGASANNSCCAVVKKGDYWKTTGASIVWFVPDNE